MQAILHGMHVSITVQIAAASACVNVTGYGE